MSIAIKTALITLLFFIDFGIGFYCGYIKDKKEVKEMYDEAVKLNDEASESLRRAAEKLNDAKAFLESTNEIRDDAKAFWEEAEKRLAEAKKISGGWDECSGGV